MRIFLDACVIIYGVEDTGDAGNTVREQLLEAPDDAEFISTELVRFELLSSRHVQGSGELKAEYEKLLEFFTITALTRADFDRAIALRTQHALKALDAMHLAAAANRGCTELWTNDQKMLAVDSEGETTVRRMP